MILFHVTSIRNWPSIKWGGLQAWRAQGTLKVVWLCTESRVRWAMAHVCGRHGWELSDLMILRVQMHRKHFRHARRGLWMSARDINPNLLEQV